MHYAGGRDGGGRDSNKPNKSALRPRRARSAVGTANVVVAGASPSASRDRIAPTRHWSGRTTRRYFRGNSRDGCRPWGEARWSKTPRWLPSTSWASWQRTGWIPKPVLRSCRSTSETPRRFFGSVEISQTLRDGPRHCQCSGFGHPAETDRRLAARCFPSAVPLDGLGARRHRRSPSSLVDGREGVSIIPGT